MTDSLPGPTHRQASWFLGLVLCFGAMFGARGAQAQTSLGRLYDKWQIDASGAVVIMGTTIRVDGSEGQGTDVKSDDLGWKLGGQFWAPAPRVDALYEELSASSK